MPPGSKRFKSLNARLDELRRHLLFFIPYPPVSKVKYSAQEHDFTRAYVVLAHAEVETFCEAIALERARRSKDTYKATNTVEPVLRKMISYYVAKERKSWQNVLSPAANVVDSAYASYGQVISNNHGIKRINLEKFLFPLGFHDSHIDPTWSAQMDSFGLERGNLAHQSSRTQQPPDPLSQLQAVRQLLPGLLDLERRLRKM